MTRRIKRKILVSHIEPEGITDDAIAERLANAINYLMKEKKLYEQKLRENKKADGSANQTTHSIIERA